MKRIRNGDQRFAIDVVFGVVAMSGASIGRWENARAQRRRPIAMPGIDSKRIRRRPRRSMRLKATAVATIFVLAITMAVAVGFLNPTMENIVAEKYINELKPQAC